jgi:hypothetical protein
MANTFSKVHLYHSSKIKSHKKTLNSRNQVFLNFLLVDGRTRIRTNKLRIWMRIRKAQKHTDPEHAIIRLNSVRASQGGGGPQQGGHGAGRAIRKPARRNQQEQRKYTIKESTLILKSFKIYLQMTSAPQGAAPSPIPVEIH